jgi:predicted RNA methylase
MNRDQITALIRHQTAMTVRSGPFTGMRLSPELSWGDGDLAPKLLGTYEQKLRPFLSRMVSRNYGAIVDIGCTEGYYAVGAARLFPPTKVFAFDADPSALDILDKNVRLNCVEAAVEVRSVCTPGTPIELAESNGPLLVICDCEGYQGPLFSDRATQTALQTALRHSDLIFECHDVLNSLSTAQCIATFSGTHLVENVYNGGGNPNVLPFLSGLNDVARWMAVCEGRPCLMKWVLCQSRQLHA